MKQKRWIAVLLAVLLLAGCLSVTGAAAGCSGLLFRVCEDGTAAVSGCLNLFIRKIEVPDTYLGHPVTAIDQRAFAGRQLLKSVSLPESITTIGTAAFENCSALEQIDLPNGLTAIEDGVFLDCASLPEIKIPESVTSIGNGAFMRCSSLREVWIPDGVTQIGAAAFAGCSALGSVRLPDGLRTIGASAFLNCIPLQSVEVPDSVTEIGDSAFASNPNLVRVVYPEHLTKLGEKTVEETPIEDTPENWTDGFLYIGRNLIKAVVQGDVCRLRDDTACIAKNALIATRVKAYAISERNERYKTDETGVLYTKAGDELLRYPAACPAERYRIAEGVRVLSSFAFLRCDALTAVEFPEGLIEIGDGCFQFSGITQDLVLPEGTRTIVGYAFRDSSVSRMYLPKSVDTFYADLLPYTLTDLYYGGTKEEWEQNASLYDVSQTLHYTIHYNADGIPGSAPSTPVEPTTGAPVTEPPATETPEPDLSATEAAVATADRIALAVMAPFGVKVDEAKKQVSIAPGKTVGDLPSLFANIGLRLKKNGGTSDENTKIGTGSVIEVPAADGAAASIYTVIVPMDADGDGAINSADARAILRSAAHLAVLDGVYAKAAECGETAKVSSSAARRVLRVAARLDTIDAYWQ